jgi:hypothetical protein
VLRISGATLTLLVLVSSIRLPFFSPCFIPSFLPALFRHPEVRAQRASKDERLQRLGRHPSRLAASRRAPQDDGLQVRNRVLAARLCARAMKRHGHATL